MDHNSSSESLSTSNNEAYSQKSNIVANQIANTLNKSDPGLQLLTPELLDRFAQVPFRTDEIDPLFIAKFRNFGSNTEWYASHFNASLGLFFGFIHDTTPRWDVFTLQDLLDNGRDALVVLDTERIINFREIYSSEMME